MNGANFRVDYTVEDGWSRQEPRHVDVFVRGNLTDEQLERLPQFDGMKLLENEEFQHLLLHAFELNGHHVVPLDEKKGAYTSKVKDEPLYKAEIQITAITFDQDFEERSRRALEFLDVDF